MLEINYQCMSAEKLASTGAKFDVIYASEVINVVERKLLLKTFDMLNPNGVVIITTINRTRRSLIFAKFALEYIVHLIPGTHDPRKFVRPDELWSEFASEGIILDDMVGFAPSPFGDFSMVGTLAINYLKWRL